MCSSDLGDGEDIRRRARVDQRAGAVFGREIGVKRAAQHLLDRKSVVEGKSVDLGGRRIIKKKKRLETPIILIEARTN